jgi:hypothetical protein
MPRIPPETRYYLNTLCVLNDVRILPAVHLISNKLPPHGDLCLLSFSPLAFGCPVNHYISSTLVSTTEHFVHRYIHPNSITKFTEEVDETVEQIPETFKDTAKRLLFTEEKSDSSPGDNIFFPPPIVLEMRIKPPLTLPIPRPVLLRHVRHSWLISSSASWR